VNFNEERDDGSVVIWMMQIICTSLQTRVVNIARSFFISSAILLIQQEIEEVFWHNL